mgnify:CR=1 FL=1
MAKSHNAQAAQAWTLRAQSLNEATARSNLIVPSDDAQRGTAQWLKATYAECTRDDPIGPPLSPSTAQPRHRGQTPMSPHDPIQPHPPRTTADCIGQPPPKGPSALSPEVTLRSIDGAGLSTSHGDDRSKQVTTGDDRKQRGNPRLIHRAMI